MDGITVYEAGRMGGLKLYREKGGDYFRAIGQKGQKVMRERYPGKASEWGKKGGRPKKPDMNSKSRAIN